MNKKKSMNTHLHLLEAYSDLYRAWPNPQLRERLRELIHLFSERIVDPAAGHLRHFFDETWQPRSADDTFGHDIEASWLLADAAEVLADQEVTSRAQRLAVPTRLSRKSLSGRTRIMACGPAWKRSKDSSGSGSQDLSFII